MTSSKVRAATAPQFPVLMKATNLFQNIVTAVLTLCAVTVTGLLVRREFTERGVAAPVANRQAVSDWRRYAEEGRRAGPAEAAVTIVEFSDFQCPFCRSAAATLDSLREEYPRDVAIVYRHFPSPRHLHAVAAAQASECAGAQGRFWEMHDALYAKQDSIGAVAWTGFASKAGIGDPDAFDACMRTALDQHEALGNDTVAARRLRVDATPTLTHQPVPGRRNPSARHPPRLRTGGPRIGIRDVSEVV